MPVSECRSDDQPLFRLEFPAFSGHLGGVAPHGATFVDGVAQNGVTEPAMRRLCGAIGPSLRVVGPWLDAPPAPPLVAAPPAGGDAPSVPQPSRTPRRR